MSDPTGSTPRQPSAFRTFDGTAAETAAVGDMVLFWAGAATAPAPAVVVRVYGNEPNDPDDSTQRGLVDLHVFDRGTESLGVVRVPHLAVVTAPAPGWEHRPTP